MLVVRLYNVVRITWGYLEIISQAIINVIRWFIYNFILCLLLHGFCVRVCLARDKANKAQMNLGKRRKEKIHSHKHIRKDFRIKQMLR